HVRAGRLVPGPARGRPGAAERGAAGRDAHPLPARGAAPAPPLGAPRRAGPGLRADGPEQGRGRGGGRRPPRAAERADPGGGDGRAAPQRAGRRRGRGGADLRVAGSGLAPRPVGLRPRLPGGGGRGDHRRRGGRAREPRGGRPPGVGGSADPRRVKPARVRAPRRVAGGLAFGLSLAVLGAMTLLAAWPGLVTSQSPTRQSLLDRHRPPGHVDEAGRAHPLGPRPLGRDVWSRLIHGARASLTVGYAGLLLGAGLGVTLGLAAGFRGGALDRGLVGLIDAYLSFPYVLIAIVWAALVRMTIGALVGI